MDPERLLLAKVESFIRTNEMLDKATPVLVGLSGGADSTALLDVLFTLGYKCIAAHCNFRLRGEEAVRDHEFARMIARDYRIEFHEIEFNTKEYAAQRGISIEMACRDLRYEWFEELLAKTGAQAIAVGHHRDDSIETFFLNLSRGTGIAGLTGINAVHGNVIRPLLAVSRQEIEEYLGRRHIDFIIDSSNQEDIYLRNKIRLQLIPLLRTINPSISESLIKTIGNLQQVEKVYDHVVKSARNEVVSVRDEEVFISIDKLNRQVAPQTILFELLREYDVPSSMIQDIIGSLNGISGKQFYAGFYRIVKDRDYLIISKRNVEDTPDHYYIPHDVNSISKPLEMSFETLDYFPGFVIPKTKDVICLDADKVAYPLELRHWQKGDKFIPFGMRGVKKVSDYFSDHKYSVLDKEKAWILTSEDKILWIVGERADNRFRLTAKTKRVLMITVGV